MTTLCPFNDDLKIMLRPTRVVPVKYYFLLVLFFFAMFSKDVNAESFYERAVNWLSEQWRSSEPAIRSENIIGVDLHGKSWELSDFSSDYVLINFWASWCQPCREEMPVIAEYAARYPSTNLRVVALNVHDNKDAAMAMINELNVELHYLFDESRHAAKKYHADAIPLTLLLNKKTDEILMSWRGKSALKEMGDYLNELFVPKS